MIGTIDRDYVDVDFQAMAKQVGKLCGMIPPSGQEERFGSTNLFEASYEPYPENEWASRIKDKDAAGTWPLRQARFLHDQNGEPSCVYNMAAMFAQYAFFRQTGVHVKFSAISGYRNNGTPRSGSSVPGSGVWLSTKGLLPSDIPENQWLKTEHGLILHRDNGYSQTPSYDRESQASKDTRKLFMIDEWMKITSVGGWVRALLDGWMVGGGRDGHAIAHGELGLDGRSLMSIYFQSWGVPWGFAMPIYGPDGNPLKVKSFGSDSRRKIEVMVSRGAYACRTCVASEFSLGL